MSQSLTHTQNVHNPEKENMRSENLVRKQTEERKRKKKFKEIKVADTLSEQKKFQGK